MQTPLLIISDCASQNSGLARAARDIASVLSTQPEWRVAVLGAHGMGSSRLPFQTYHMLPGEWGESSLPLVWDEWSGGRQGIVFTIWDLSRLLWLARPEYASAGTREWLQARRDPSPSCDGGFRLWSYVPLDSTGPGNRLSGVLRETLLGIDRVLVTSPWAEGVVRNTIGPKAARDKGLAWLPHAIDGKTWNRGEDHEHCADRVGEDVVGAGAGAGAAGGSLAGVAGGAREPAGAATGEVVGRGDGGSSPVGVVVGVVATNQQRKDWGLVAAVCRGLRDAHPSLKFWWHVDQVRRWWNLQALVEDYGLGDAVEITTPPLDDGILAQRYRSCAITLHPGLGEGFGYPIFESLACGVPAVHGDYASGASLMSTCGLAHLLVQPVALRVEGEWNSVRPVYDPEDWVRVAGAWLGARVPVEATEHLRWEHLAQQFRKWFRAGLGGGAR